MYDYDLELVKALTNTTAEVRGRLARYWGRQAEQVQIEAVKAFKGAAGDDNPDTTG